jgi:hypothetical protein
MEKARGRDPSEYHRQHYVRFQHTGQHQSSLRAIVLTSMEIDQEPRERMGRYALSMMSKQMFTKKDLLKEIGSLGSLS